MASVGYQTLTTLTSNGYKTAADTLVDVANVHYTKTELDPLICKARASYTHSGGSSGTGTLANVVGIAPNPSVGTLVGYLIGSPGTQHTLYPVDFAFATARSSVDYQVLVTEVQATSWMVGYRITISNKTVNGFQISIMVDEGVPSGQATPYLAWGVDIVVF